MLKQKTVYFREEDLVKWEAVENKAEFLHNALNGMSINFGEDVGRVDLMDVRLHKNIPKPIKTPNEVFDEELEDIKKLESNDLINGKAYARGHKAYMASNKEIAEKKLVMGMPSLPTLKLCKHGAHPSFCKFAKPGKLCK